MIKNLEEYNKIITKINTIKINPPHINEEYVNSLGIDHILFKSKYNKLCKTWWGLECLFIFDCEAKRFVTNIISSHINEPIIIAMISDDVDMFKKYFTDRHIYYVDFCCLCGSNKIIEDIYFKYNKEHLLKSMDAIGFAISSDNYKLAKDIAIIFKQNKKDHGIINLYSVKKESYLCVKYIEELFSNI